MTGGMTMAGQGLAAMLLAAVLRALAVFGLVRAGCGAACRAASLLPLAGEGGPRVSGGRMRAGLAFGLRGPHPHPAVAGAKASLSRRAGEGRGGAHPALMDASEATHHGGRRRGGGAGVVRTPHPTPDGASLSPRERGGVRPAFAEVGGAGHGGGTALRGGSARGSGAGHGSGAASATVPSVVRAGPSSAVPLLNTPPGGEVGDARPEPGRMGRGGGEAWPRARGPRETPLPTGERRGGADTAHMDAGEAPHRGDGRSGVGGELHERGNGRNADEHSPDDERGAPEHDEPSGRAMLPRAVASLDNDATLIERIL